MIIFTEKHHDIRFIRPQTSQLYNMRRLCGHWSSQGPFGALATVNISANPAWFARDLPLYLNLYDAMQKPTAFNLYGRVTEGWVMQHRVCVGLNSRLCPSGEHILQKRKKVVRRHTRSSTSVISAATVESSTSTAGSVRRKTQKHKPRTSASAPVS